jgi:hypothetical protein
MQIPEIGTVRRCYHARLTKSIAAVFGIGALVIGVDLAQLGYQKVRRLVKGAH